MDTGSKSPRNVEQQSILPHGPIPRAFSPHHGHRFDAIRCVSENGCEIFNEIPEIDPSFRCEIKDDLIAIKCIFHIDELHVQLMFLVFSRHICQKLFSVHPVFIHLDRRSSASALRIIFLSGKTTSFSSTSLTGLVTFPYSIPRAVSTMT